MIPLKQQRIRLSHCRWKVFAGARIPSAQPSPGVACALAILLSVSSLLADDFATEQPEIRRFTNKAGQEIEAHTIAVSSSMRTVTIQRPGDDRRFDLEITALCLDDQQYLKEWLRKQPAREPGQLNLRLEGQPFLTEATREKFEDRIYGGSGTSSQVGYQFKINNLSRIPLLDCRLEYVVLVEDRVEIRMGGLDKEAVRWRLRAEGPVIYRSGDIAIDTLKYNTEFNVISATIPHEQIRAGSGSNKAEDQVLGVLARLTSADGTPLVEFSDVDSRHSHLNWDSFAQLRDSAETEDGAGTLAEALVSR